jgi:hypothetical protein
MKTMVINGAHYAEATGTCAGCAFDKDPGICGLAYDESILAFGRNCGSTDICYVRTVAPTAAMDELLKARDAINAAISALEAAQ